MAVAQLDSQTDFPARTWQEVEELISENNRFKAHSGSVYFGHNTVIAEVKNDSGMVHIEYTGAANQAVAANELKEYCIDKRIRFEESIRGPRTILSDIRAYGENLVAIADRLNGAGGRE